MIRRAMQFAFFGPVLAVLLTATAIIAAPVRAESAKLDPALHARALERAKDLPRLRSLLISIDGELVEERYFNGARASQTHES